MATQQSPVHQITQFSPAELALLERPQTILEDPAPHSKRGQQVQRLEQLGLHKVASAVKACGRLGELWTFACGKYVVRKIIRSHRRFCCPQCDSHVAGRVFEEHRAYTERQNRSGTLHRVSIRSGDYQLSRDGVGDFEQTTVKAVGRWLKGIQGWGFKSQTHYEGGALAIEGILYLSPGTSLPSRELSISHGSCRVGVPVDVTAFEALLADILKPRVLEGNGVARAELMAAFQGGNHLRSMGVFYGLISKKREEERRERTAENLDLSNNTPVSGAGSDQRERAIGAKVPTCPYCGPTCRRIAVTVENLSDLVEVPRMEEQTSCRTGWELMRSLLRRRYVFWGSETAYLSHEELIDEN